MSFSRAPAASAAWSCVVQLIADDGILGGEQNLKQAAVGIEAGGVEDGVLGAEEPADSSFQLLVDGLGTADKADRGQAVTVCVVGGLGSLCQLPVVCQA